MYAYYSYFRSFPELLDKLPFGKDSKKYTRQSAKLSSTMIKLKFNNIITADSNEYEAKCRFFG